MTEASTRVCPRCGDPAGESKFCATCGLHLHEQPELPTRSEWEERTTVAETAPSASPTHARSVSETISALRPAHWVGIGVACAVIIGLLIAVTGGGGGGSSEASETPYEDTAQASPTAEEICVSQWNSGASNVAKSMAGILTLSGGGDSLTYVSAGFAADFPDRCLITFARAGGSASQFTADADGTFQYPSASNIPIGNLDESVKAWIGHGDRKGNITLGMP
jgi:hypothetical protein